MFAALDDGAVVKAQGLYSPAMKSGLTSGKAAKAETLALAQELDALVQI